LNRRSRALYPLGSLRHVEYKELVEYRGTKTLLYERVYPREINPKIKGKLKVKIMIVKVQLSISSSEPGTFILIYNKDRSIMYESDAAEDIIVLMGLRVKAYFYAEIDSDNRIAIGDTAEDQNW
jgi:hypothetical protein